MFRQVSPPLTSSDTKHRITNRCHFAYSINKPDTFTCVAILSPIKRQRKLRKNVGIFLLFTSATFSLAGNKKLLRQFTTALFFFTFPLNYTALRFYLSIALSLNVTMLLCGLLASSCSHVQHNPEDFFSDYRML